MKVDIAMGDGLTRISVGLCLHWTTQKKTLHTPQTNPAEAKYNMMYNLPFCGSGPKRNSDQTLSVHGPHRSSLSITCFVRIPFALDSRLFWLQSGNRNKAKVGKRGDAETAAKQ
jgi:hypothetical protein